MFSNFKVYKNIYYLSDIKILLITNKIYFLKYSPNYIIMSNQKINIQYNGLVFENVYIFLYLRDTRPIFALNLLQNKVNHSNQLALPVIHRR